jgi:hypothetical protein
MAQGIELAIRAFGVLVDNIQKKESNGAELPRLVVAGGYDIRLAENRAYFEELKNEAAALGLQDKVGPRVYKQWCLLTTAEHTISHSRPKSIKCLLIADCIFSPMSFYQSERAGHEGEYKGLARQA